MSVTIKDVAKKAGVATSTVSRTIQDSPSISEKTKQNVRRVMEEIGYRPNLTARGLVNQTTQTIGVILPVSERQAFQNTFFLSMIRGISKACNEKKYMVAIASGTTEEELLESIKTMAHGGRVDGFIVLYSKKDDSIIEYLHQEKVPYAMIGKPYKYENEMLYVDNDNVIAGKDATNYLLELGHEKIAFIGEDAKQMVIRERLKGYGQALEDAGMAMNPELILDVTLPEEAYRKKMQQLFGGSEFPTGIVASDDLIALNMSYLLSGFGLKIPSDVSIIGFNNSIFAEKSQPELTSIDLHTDSLTSQTVYQLVDLIEGRQTLAVKMVLPHQIIERQSCIRKEH